MLSFGRRSSEPDASGDESPAANAPRELVNPIAEIELLGETVVATLTVTELSQDTGSNRLAELLFDLGESGAKNFVLDIQNVQYMDSACLGCLVEALNQLARGDGKIVLANVDNAVHDLFRLTRLDRLFPICKDVMNALVTIEGRPE